MTDDDRIASILGEWIEKRNRGEEIDPEEVIAAHPEFAKELRRRFRALSLLESSDPGQPGSGSLPPLREGRYGDFRVAGEGGMGIVYWALDTDLNRQVAFKIVRPDAGGLRQMAPSIPIGMSPPAADTPASQAFETLKARFLQEAWVTAGLEHPGIVPVYELGQTQEGVPYYTMRFVRGSQTLATAIEEAKGQLIETRVALLEPFLRVCDTIRYAHAHGVIHRDLKPENVAIGEFGEVVVLDWGLAKMRDQEDTAAETWQERLKDYREATDLHTMASAMGTPGYMAPEAALGRIDELDERCDVYSLGAILFQILTGRLPFEFQTFIDFLMKVTEEDAPLATEFDPAVPEALSAICANALARDRDGRIVGAGEFAEALRAWQRESAVQSEVRGLLAKAEAAFEGTEGLEGEALLKQIDRVTSSCTLITERSPAHPRAEELTGACAGIRERAIAQRERAARGRLLKRVAVTAVVLLLAVAGVFVLIVDAKRRQAEEAERGASLARHQAETERDAKERSLRHARALALANASALEGRHDQMCALMLAREAARLEINPIVLTRLHESLVASRERAILRGHEGSVASAVFSPAGDLILTASEDNTARLWDLEGHEITVLRGHEEKVVAASFSPAGDRILTASADETARLWDLTGREVAVLRAHNWPLSSAVFSSAGDLILTASDDNTARLWDLEGRELAVLRGHKWAVVSAVFSPAGDRILTSSVDRTARLWDLEGRELAVFRGHEAQIFSAVFSPAGDLVLTASWDKTARLWDLKGREIAVFRGHEASIHSAVFSPAGDRILTASRDDTARLWDRDGRLVTIFRGHDSYVWSAVFLPAGDRILTSSFDKTARLWDLRGRELAVFRGHEWGVLSVRISPAGDRILTSSLDKTARLWDLEGRELAVFRGHEREVSSVRISPAGDRILTASLDKTARLWDLEGREIAVLRGHSDMVSSAIFSPVGDLILTHSRDKTLRLWDLKGNELAVLRGHEGPFWSAIFSPAGDLVLSASVDKTARLWNLEGKEIAIFRGHEQPVASARFSPAGDLIVTASGDDTVRLWDLKGNELEVLRGHEKGVRSARFSPAGNLILTASYDGTARIWDLKGNRISVLRGHEADIYSAVFSPTGDLVLTASLDKTARLWDLEGREIAILRGHEDRVGSAAFSSAGDRILTRSADKTARLWDLEGRELAVFREHKAELFRAALSPSGDLLLTASADKTARLWLVHAEDLLKLASERIIRDFTPRELQLYGDLLGTAGRDK